MAKLALSFFCDWVKVPYIDMLSYVKQPLNGIHCLGVFSLDEKNPYHCPENYSVCSNYVILMNNITYNYIFQPYSLYEMYFRMT